MIFPRSSFSRISSRTGSNRQAEVRERVGCEYRQAWKSLLQWLGSNLMPRHKIETANRYHRIMSVFVKKDMSIDILGQNTSIRSMMQIQA